MSVAKSPWRFVLTVFLLWEGLMMGIGYMAPYKVHAGPRDPWAQLSVSDALRHTVKFDAIWYRDIATRGYAYSHSTPTFYPLFPALVSVVGRVTGDPVWAGFLINAVAALVAFYYFFLLARDYFQDEGLASFALLLFAFFPTAYFLHVMYSEALFCALAVSAFYYARRRRWLVANSLVACATGTRLIGLVLAGAVAVEYAQSIGYDWRRLNRSAWSFAIAPAGIVAFAVYLGAAVGDPLAMLHAYKFNEWGEEANWNVPMAAYAEARLIVTVLTERAIGWQVRLFDQIVPFAAWIGLGACTVWSFFKPVPHGYRVLLAGSFLLFGAHTVFFSTHRYVLPVFPIYLVLAEWLRPASDGQRSLVLAVFATSLAFLYVLFANGIWTA